MANDFCDILLTAGPLSAAPLEFPRTAGAVVEFLGVVRGEEAGATIHGLDYEAFPAMAEQQLLSLAEAVRMEFALEKVLVHHRWGFVPVGEVSVRVAVASPHRPAAFAGCAKLIDELKRIAPIWKKPSFAR